VKTGVDIAQCLQYLGQEELFEMVELELQMHHTGCLDLIVLLVVDTSVEGMK
jgi:hypothetical protein